MAHAYRKPGELATMTLEEAIAKVRELDVEESLYARKPWARGSACVIAPSGLKLDGFPYFLDVPTAREVLEVLDDADGRDLDDEVHLLIFYAENDAFPTSVSGRSEAVEVDGIYVSHWENACFLHTSGRRLFGLLPKVERWHVIFPDSFRVSRNDPASFRHAPPKRYRLHALGDLSEPGYFGHKGCCSRELRISSVISCEEEQ